MSNAAECVGMRTKTETMRRIHELMLREIDTESRDIPLTDRELAERISVTLKRQINQNRVWYLREKFGVPSARVRKLNYEENKNVKDKK